MDPYTHMSSSSGVDEPHGAPLMTADIYLPPRTKTKPVAPRRSGGADESSEGDDDSDSKEGEGNEQDKKLRRLLKNRESAHQSRIRKKNYITELEKRTSELTGANADLQTRVNTLTTENKLLKDQLSYLRIVLSQAATNVYQQPQSATSATATATATSATHALHHAPFPPLPYPPGLYDSASSAPAPSLSLPLPLPPRK